jgi:Uma2 family endonuclease
MNVNLAAAVSVALPEDIETVVVQPQRRLSDADFERFCAQYPELRIEMTKEGDMIIMMPVVSEGGGRNFILSGRFFNWVESDDTGVGFDSSTGFTLPNGAKRSPDVSWIRRERWEALSEQQKNEFAPICPDFVVELRSKSDRLVTLKAKLEEYLANGAQLGWLIDPLEKKVYIYRPAAPVEVLDNPAQISGEPFLKGFSLKLSGILD